MNQLARSSVPGKLVPRVFLNASPIGWSLNRSVPRLSNWIFSFSSFSTNSTTFAPSTSNASDSKQQESLQKEQHQNDPVTTAAATNMPSPAAVDISLENERSPNHIPGRYAIVYTCEVCELRAAKSFSKHAYHKGIVLIRCDGCDSLHMIADNLGWFDHGKNIEAIFEKMGREMHKLSSDQARQLMEVEPKLKQFVLQAEAEHRKQHQHDKADQAGADGECKAEVLAARAPSEQQCSKCNSSFTCEAAASSQPKCWCFEIKPAVTSSQIQPNQGCMCPACLKQSVLDRKL